MSYRSCFECGEVWETREEFQAANERTYAEMNAARDWEGERLFETPLVPPEPEDETICPECTHDL